MQQIQSQLTVIGAGPAGICAALAAARNGIDTVLICERPVLGGNSSSEFRVWTRGATGAGNLFAEEMGIWGELKLANLYRNPDANPIFWDETLLDAALSQDHLRLFLNTTVFKTEHADNRISSVQGVQLGTEKELQFVSDYYIDASGDGTIAQQAGMEYTVGTAEGTLGSSILYYTRKEDHPVKFVAPSYAYSFDKIRQLMNHGGRIISEKMSGCDCWWFEYGGTRNTIQDEQEITIELKRLVLGVWNYIKNSGSFAADNYTLEWIGNMAGKRESRRMKTTAELKAEDIYQQVRYSDAGFYGGWYIDYHPPGGINDSAKDNCIQRPVNVYQIPLRCLYGEIKNLVIAGRIIGTDNEAFFSSRVMNTCAMSGQAAGTLAACCIEEKKEVPAVNPSDIQKVQQTLLKDDMFIPSKEENDQLRRGTVQASSEHDAKASAPIGEISLSEDTFAVFPADGRKAVLQIRSEKETGCDAEVCMSSLPNRYLKEGTVRKFHWDLQKGDQKIILDLPAEMQGKLAAVYFAKEEGVYLKYTKKIRPGFICGRTDSSKYEEPCIDIDGTGVYSADHVIDGYTRIWEGPHAWMPMKTDEDPWIRVSLDQAEVIKEIRIFLDPDLSMELVSSRTEKWRADHKYTKREGMPQQLLRHLCMEAEMEDGTVKQIAEIKDNCYRCVIVPVKETQRIKMIRMTKMETWGAEVPIVYDICAYAQ